MENNINIILKNPLIFVVDDFIDKNCCKKLLELELEYKHSEISSGLNKNIRKSFTAILDENNNLYKQINSKIFNFFSTSKEYLENLQIQKYECDGEYKEHFDARSNLLKKNQRKYSLIIYLNKDYEGGETYFTRINISIKPEIGRLLVFQNCLNHTNYAHPNSLHKGNRVIKGTKYILNSWLFQNELNIDLI